MFMISKKCCPSCGVKADIWKKQPKVLKCPICSTVFSEFGFVSLGEKQDSILS